MPKIETGADLIAALQRLDPSVRVVANGCDGFDDVQITAAKVLLDYPSS